MTDLTEAKDRMQAEEADGAIRRRDFLSLLGASFATLSLSGCDFRPPREAIVPYRVMPEDATTGVANWYASTCSGCQARCGALVKQRDGRPIKLEGNPDHPLSRGGLCARGQATVLDLYDSERLRGPLVEGSPAAWGEVDAAIAEKLAAIDASGGQIRILSSTISGPTGRHAVEKFIEAFPTARHVTYDALSGSAIVEAHAATHGERRLPTYRFDKAKLIVSFDADFLGTWLSPVEFTRGWAERRGVSEADPSMSRHVHFESRMSVTGANADQRVAVAPSFQHRTIFRLLRFVGDELGRGLTDAPPVHVGGSGIDDYLLADLARELVALPGESLVISGSTNPSAQVAVNFLNHWLGNVGSTIDLARPSLQFQGDDVEFNALIDAMTRGEVEGLIVLDANPAYDHPRAEEFRRALERVQLTVSLAGRLDETASLCNYVCPDHHALESWGDAQPRTGVYSLFQPTLAPLFDTRAAVESLMAWAGRPTSAHDLLRSVWEEQLFPKQSEFDDFKKFWNASVHDGVRVFADDRLDVPEFDEASASRLELIEPSLLEGQLEFDVHASVALGEGRQANNPWLQELPDPITKAAWGNVASVSERTGQRYDLEEGRVVELIAGDRTVALPIHIQPGMPYGVVAVALGYGRPNAGKIAANYPERKMFPIERTPPGGVDVYPWLNSPGIRVERTEVVEELAKTQIFDYQTLPFTGEERRQIRETTLDAYAGDAHAGNEPGHEIENLWPGYDYDGHKWAMSIDTNKCTGCSACVIACQAENNIPVVGKAEVRKNRELHWIRLDRYYSGSEDEPEPFPDVSFQPMLCQQCDNAPCETVCPVLATTHSSEGLNMQVYNRCIGTRYCENNCPYKVRRFNWFDYAHDDLLQNLALNPDVTVRSRGVMEKCTFCVQRINGGKRRAKAEGRGPTDADVAPACAQSCPSQAILFGDANNSESGVAQVAEDPRAYHVLEELGTLPSVAYLTKVRNKGPSRT